MSIDYTRDAETVRWPALLRRIATWPREEQEKILHAATTYRSGTDSCNSVYMGSIAHAILRRALGDGYPGTESYADLLPNVSNQRIMMGIEAAMHIIEYMLENPRKKCPCCGQITNAE